MLVAVCTQALVGGACPSGALSYVTASTVFTFSLSSVSPSVFGSAFAAGFVPVATLVLVGRALRHVLKVFRD